MRKLNRGLFFILLLLSLAPAAIAQSWGPLSLEELKKETQRRSDRNLPPLTGIKPDDTREAMGMLTDLEPDTWAAAWSKVGERYLARARDLEKS